MFQNGDLSGDEGFDSKHQVLLHVGWRPGAEIRRKNANGPLGLIRYICC